MWIYTVVLLYVQLHPSGEIFLPWLCSASGIMRTDHTERWEDTVVPSLLKTIHFLHLLCSPDNPATFAWSSPDLAT